MSKLNNQGITLLEAMITIVVIMIGVLILANIFPIAFKISESAKQATIATNLAQAKLEELFSLNYDNIAIGVIEVNERLSADPNNYLYDYQRETLTEYVDQNLQTSVSETDLKKMTVNVYYKSSALKTEKSVQLTSLISKK